MSIWIRKSGRVGRITLHRDKALNAITWDMIREISMSLPRWAHDDTVEMVVIDAEGDRAFCAGGDIAEIYAALVSTDFETPRRFWREEYQMNAMLYHFPKPVVTFLQGYTMGGGVGVGCHASHRVVGASSRIAMPECSIGLVPDIGGSLLLARTPGRVGTYLGTTAARMGPGDAIFAGFADYFVAEERWPSLIANIEATATLEELEAAAQPAPDSALKAEKAEIDPLFAGKDLREILDTLQASDSVLSQRITKALNPNAPLAMAAAVALIEKARGFDSIEPALIHEYRFVHRIVAQGDFREGIRAAIIDKDKSPKWTHTLRTGPTPDEIAAVLAPLGEDDWSWEGWG